MRIRRLSPSLGRPVAALALTALSTAALCATNPYHLSLSQSVQRDSYMARYGGSGADWISSTGLRAGVDQSFGRQQWLLDASFNHDEYRRNDRLSNDNYGISARWNWATVDRISGSVSAQSARNLYKNSLTAQLLGRTMLRTDSAQLQTQIGLVTRWTFDASLVASRQTPSSSSTFFDSLDTRQTTLGTGIRWSPSTPLSLRVGARRTLGELPRYGDDFARNDLDLSADYLASGTSSLSTQVSRTRLTHSLTGLSNVSAWTGLFAWNWQTTGKLRLTLTASRDSSLGASNAPGAFISQSTSNTLLSDSLALATSWQATAKLRADTRIGHTRRQVDNSSSLTIGSVGSTTDRSGRDTISTASLGLTYLPTRWAELGCSASLEAHRITADDPNNRAITAPPYNARSYGCNGKLLLR